MRCDEACRLLVTEETVTYRTGPLERHLEHCECCREEAARLGREVRLFRLAFLYLPIRDDFIDEVFRIAASG